MTDRPNESGSEAHPVDYGDLIAFAAGVAGPTDPAAIAAHLATCPACATTVARFRLVQQTVREDESLAPSAVVVARVRALAAGRRRPTPGRVPPLAALRRLVAPLTFDGRSRPAPVGLRGSPDGYLLAYAASGIEVDIEVSPDPGTGAGRWQIMGQVAGSIGLGGAEIALAAPGKTEPVVGASSDDDGIFTLQAESGRYDLLVRLPEGLVVLPDLRLGQRD